jgi:hypothetical protein
MAFDQDLIFLVVVVMVEHKLVVVQAWEDQVVAEAFVASLVVVVEDMMDIVVVLPWVSVADLVDRHSFVVLVEIDFHTAAVD